MSSEKDFIEFLIFRDKFTFLRKLITSFPERFEGTKIFKDEYEDYKILTREQDFEDVDDIIDYELDLTLNDTGYGYYGRYLCGEFFNKEDAGIIIRDGLEYNLVKYYE